MEKDWDTKSFIQILPFLNNNCLACAYLILHSFLKHSCFCLSKSFMWSLFIECAWSKLCIGYIVPTSIMIIIITWAYILNTHILISNLCECWYHQSKSIYIAYLSTFPMLKYVMERFVSLPRLPTMTLCEHGIHTFYGAISFEWYPMYQNQFNWHW